MAIVSGENRAYLAVYVLGLSCYRTKDIYRLREMATENHPSHLRHGYKAIVAVLGRHMKSLFDIVSVSAFVTFSGVWCKSSMGD